MNNQYSDTFREWWMLHPSGYRFLTEDFVQSYANKYHAIDNRLWGGIISHAKRAGYIRDVGYKLDSFGSPKTLWEIV